MPISTKLSAKDEIWVVSSARRIEDESPTGVPLLREMNVVYGPKLYGAEPKILKCKDSKRNRALYACWPESGDVGGPVFKKIGTKWELVGIQSWMTLDPWNQSQESLGRAYSDFHEIVNWHWYLDKTYHHKYRDAFSKDFPFAFSVGWMTPEIEALVK